MHKKLPHLIYFALATNYFNVFMSTTVLLELTSFGKIGCQWIFGGGSDFSNLLAPWASGSRSLMLRAAFLHSDFLRILACWKISYKTSTCIALISDRHLSPPTLCIYPALATRHGMCNRHAPACQSGRKVNLTKNENEQTETVLK